MSPAAGTEILDLACGSGELLYAGEHQLAFGDRLTALPMAALWTLGNSAP